MSEALLTIVINTYPPKPMELLTIPNLYKFNKAVSTMGKSCSQFKPGLCARQDASDKMWYINRHHRSEIENLARDYFSSLTVEFRKG